MTLTCAFSGHRPEKLPWREDESDPRCPSQSSAWPREIQLRYLRGLDVCDRTIVLEERYSDGCMLRRNRYMVEHADILMTVFDGSPGGTAATVRYARSRGLQIISIWR